MNKIIIGMKAEVEKGYLNDNNAILISLLSTVETPLDTQIKAQFLDVLDLVVDDLTFYPPEYDEIERKSIHLFNVSDFLKIENFVKKYPGKQIIVHCAAGVSRSPAVAIGICSILDDKELMLNTIRSRSSMIPNNLILWEMLKFRYDRDFDFYFIYEEILKQKESKNK